ncbi:MAG TPA: hypothetical protein VF572_00560 [Candidatus Saccharimonadales bacterium]
MAFLRGKLLFGQHILINSVTQDKFYLRTDEFLADNPLNRVFAYVTRILLSTTTSPANKKLLSELRLILDGVDDRPVRLIDADRIVLSRLNARFSPALQLAKLFLAGGSLQMQSQDFQTSTFLIDMNKLFEDFIAHIVQRVAAPDVLVHTQGPIRHLVEAQYDLDGTKIRDKTYRTIPDIALSPYGRSKHPQHIIDTKYKILDEDTESDLGVSQKDLYQMYAYAGVYNCPRITLLYPLRSGQTIREQMFALGKKCEVSIRTVDLRRDIRTNISQIERDVADVITSDLRIPVDVA